MQRILSVIIIFNLVINSSIAQSPLVKQWDKRYGGTEPDLVTALIQTSDGGFIAGGFSFSDSSGNKSQDNWGGTTYADFWLVKTNGIAQKVWDKHYGGTGTDVPSEIIVTSDGGYLLTGSSNSGVNGDKTQPSWSGSIDYWIVKIDSGGNKLWDKRYGGLDDDYAASAVQLTDGGFLIAGTSRSGIGGNKTQSGWGSSDYWVIRIDAVGNVMWDKRFGGTDSDDLQSLIVTADNNFLIGGTSGSGISGDRTENSRGFDDYWIVKFDTLGTKLWDKRYGGNQSDELMNILQTPDGGYLLSGNSSSAVSPDKSNNPFGNFDFWVLKIDSAGVKQWDKIYGGTDKEEQEGTLIKTFDGNYVISGSSYSPVSGNKTEANLGFEQAWLMKFDSLGAPVYDKTIFTVAHDEQCKLIQSSDGCFVLVIQSDAAVGGYKSEPPWGFYFDYWMIKMCDTTAVAPPVAAFNFTDSIDCGEVCNYFSDSSQNNPITWQWYFPGAQITTSTAKNPGPVCYDSTGQYNITLVVCNSGGCDSIQQLIQINVPTAAVVSLGNDTSFCAGDSIQLIANGNFISYQWQLNNINLSLNSAVIIASQQGTYSVTVSDSLGCMSNDSLIVTVNTVTVSAGNDTAVCANDSVLITAISSASSFQWFLNNVSFNQTSPSIIINQPGSYSVIATSAEGCTTTDDINLTVHDLPIIQTIDDTSICDSGSVMLTTSGALFYSWTPSAFLNDDSIATPVSTPLNTINYTVTGTDSNGCKNTDEVNISFGLTPAADFDYSLNFSCEGIELKTKNKSANAIAYQWDFHDNNISTETSPVHFYSSLQNLPLQLIAYNASCSDTLVKILSFEKPSFIDSLSNVFTPNGDGNNDCFDIGISDNLLDCYIMKIFNRWGKQVFTSDENICWNGKLNNTGAELPEGVYFYIVTIGEIKFNSSLTLIR